MAKKNISHRRTANDLSEAAGAEFSTFALEDEADGKILRSSLWIAAGLHFILLLINFPCWGWIPVLSQWLLLVGR